MPNISESFIESLKQRAAENIVDIIDRRVKLKRTGKTYSACCPFHDEKTPSFHVSPDKGTFKCFGSCGDSGRGGGIDFVMNYERLDFPEAVKLLASELNMGPVQYVQADNVVVDIAARRMNTAMKSAMVRAAGFYALELGKNVEAIKYLLARGFTQNDLIDFKIGFSPKSGAALSKSLLEDFSHDVLLSASLMAHDESKNQHYDFFYNRIMFPIRNEKGDCIGFGGRSISDNTKRKYINSAQSEIFNKATVLFGLYESISMPGAHHERGIHNITEGYVDVISAHRNGLTNTVATMGTAVSEHHVKKLFQRGDKIRFIQDGDKAGIASILEGMKAAAPFLTPTKTCTAVLLPDGEDLDSLLNKKDGLSIVQSLIANELPMSEFIVKYLISVNDNNTEGKAKVVQEVKGIIDRIKDENLKLVMKDTLYKALGIAPGAVSETTQYVESHEQLHARLPPPIQNALSRVDEEVKVIAGILVNEPQWIRLLQLDETAMGLIGPHGKGLINLAMESGPSALVEESHPARDIVRYLSSLAPSDTSAQIETVADFIEQLSLSQTQEQIDSDYDSEEECSYSRPVASPLD